MPAETYYDPTFTLTSPAFANEMTIPTEYTADGAGLSPPLIWDVVPEGTKSFALIVYDPDAPHGEVNHWVAYDLPGHLTGLDAGADIPAAGGLVGANTKGEQAWIPPAPPHGDAPHRYVFQVMALDRASLGLPPGATRDRVEDTAAPYTLSIASMLGYFGR
jgi:Raf kinase inhibitor-like YbhB/YbcL family protein